MKHRHNNPQFRTGFCDGIFSRPCISPYIERYQAEQYLSGFLAGKEARIKFDIKPLSAMQQ